MYSPHHPSGRAPFAVSLLNPQKDDVVLDIGCFDGALEYHFLQGKVKEFYGIDVNSNALEKANSWISNPTTRLGPVFRCTAAENLPFPDESFDKIVCLDVFEHVDDEKKVVSEIFRVLKPGGTLVLSVPHDFLNFLDPDELTRGIRNFVRKYVRKKPLLDHPLHRHYSESDLRSFFKNFQIKKIHKCGTPVFWTLAMAYTAVGLPEKLVRRLSKLTAPLENWDYKTSLPTGFNVMIQATKGTAR